MIKNNKAILCSIFVIRTKHLLNKLEISDRAEKLIELEMKFFLRKKGEN
jgi:hypothetical protein